MIPYNIRMGESSVSSRQISSLMAAGKFTVAGQVLEQVIIADPSNAQLHWQLGACYASTSRLNLAYDRFREAVRLDPSIGPAHAGLGALYLIHGIVDRALESSSEAMKLSPTNVSIQLSHARILEAAGQIDAAWELAQRLVDENRINAALLRLYGRMARYRNRQTEALTLTEQLLASGKLSVAERASMNFTAADLLDSLGRYDEAFAHAAAGNAATRPAYDPASHARTFDRFISYFTRDRLRRLVRSTEISHKPVFIVGMPRSGTSMVEQILASHPGIHGAGELDFMEHIFHGTIAMLGAKGKDYPDCLDRLTIDQATGLAQIYLQPLIAMSPGSLRFTDKLPLNFLHLGLIQLLLPGARVIRCRRDPMDTCLSCHMNSFAAGNDFKFDLTHLGLFYRQYERLMGHWSAVLDLPMLDVAYEDLVREPERETRRMLQFLDVPFDPACLEFHRADRPVLTSSLQQVRQPLYASSVQRWRKYEKHLRALKTALNASN